MSVESEARGISQRHKPWVGPDSRWHCELCHCLWGAHGCPDRLAADAITQAADEIANQLRLIIGQNATSSPMHQMILAHDRAVVALASLTGREEA